MISLECETNLSGMNAQKYLQIISTLFIPLQHKINVGNTCISTLKVDLIELHYT